MENKKPLLATRLAKSLQNFLRARFDVVPKRIAPTEDIGLYNNQDKRSFLRCNNYINPSKESKFQLKSSRFHIWKYNSYFDCKSRDVIYVTICIN